MKDIFLLRKDITFLNHGSFGACPKPVFDEYQHIQRQIESQPVEFFTRKSHELLRQSRETLAKYLNTSAQNIVYTTNTTYALNIVAQSINLQPADEVLGTNHEYGAMDRMWLAQSKKTGFKYIKHKVKLPYTNAQDFVADFCKNINKNTKVIFMSHISSASALIFPVEEICKVANEKNIITIIDGAHAPGHINLNLDELNADFYAGNCHKWMMAPKGTAFLFAKKQKQELLKPIVTSWGELSGNKYENNFIAEFQDQGTRELSGFLSVPAAIKFMNDNRHEKAIDTNKILILYAKQKLCEIFDTKPITLSKRSTGMMYAHPLPPEIKSDMLKDFLREKCKIEIPITKFDNTNLIRISIQIYNNKKDVDYFVECLKKFLDKK